MRHFRLAKALDRFKANRDRDEHQRNRVDQRRNSYPVVADSLRERITEVYQVQSVTGIRSEGLRVGVVANDNKAKLVPITIGRDDGRVVEVTVGLQPTIVPLLLMSWASP